MPGKLSRFQSLDAADKWFLLRATWLLGCARLAILTLPFKRLVASLEHLPQPQPPAEPSAEQLQAASRMGYLVAVAANHTPWQSTCLAQVLVLQRLLAAQGIPGQFYLGVRRGCERSADPTGLSAHAWLQCGAQIVNGGAGHEAFTVVSTFRWGASHG